MWLLRDLSISGWILLSESEELFWLVYMTMVLDVLPKKLLDFNTSNTIFKINWLKRYLQGKSKLWYIIPELIFKKIRGIEFLLKVPYHKKHVFSGLPAMAEGWGGRRWPWPPCVESWPPYRPPWPDPNHPCNHRITAVTTFRHAEPFLHCDGTTGHFGCVQILCVGY